MGCLLRVYNVLCVGRLAIDGGAVASAHVIRKRLIDPVIDLLRQGVTPEKIAAAIAVGIVCGLCPVLGSTTLLCALAAAVLRLNLPLIQAVNFVIYPAQLALLIPQLQNAQRVFGEPPLAITMTGLMSMIKASVWHTITFLGAATARAVLVWFFLGLLVASLIYFLLVPILRMATRSRA